MYLEKVAWFSTKHDVASEAVKKFPHILLRSCTEQIESATCQNYFARVVNSAHRDFFSRLDVCCHAVETRDSSTDQLCVIAIKAVLPRRSMKSTNDGAEAEDRSSIVVADSTRLPVARSARSLDESL